MEPYSSAAKIDKLGSKRGRFRRGHSMSSQPETQSIGKNNIIGTME